MAQPTDIIRALEIIGPLLLSGLLVILYYQQYRLQKVQLQPSLEVSDTNEEGDELRVWISNYGGGIAKDLRIETVSFVDGEEKPLRTQKPIHRADEEENRTRERAIGAGEQNVLFVCEPPFMAPESMFPGGMRFDSFSSALFHMGERGVSEIGFFLNAVY